MPHTLWHCGVLMGESDMIKRDPANPRHIAGTFVPTDYGRRLLPRVTGLLAAAAALKEEMEANGMSEDDVPESERMEEFLDSSPAGQTMIDGGRVLSEVELRDPSGARLEYKTIAFVDLDELRSVIQKLGCKTAAATLAPMPAHAPKFIVSATLVQPVRAGPVTMRVRS